MPSSRRRILSSSSEPKRIHVHVLRVCVCVYMCILRIVKLWIYQHISIFGYRHALVCLQQSIFYVNELLLLKLNSCKMYNAYKIARIQPVIAYDLTGPTFIKNNAEQH